MIPTTIPPERLARMLADNQPFSLLDVRNADEVAAWRIEVPAGTPTATVPYFDFIEDEAASFAQMAHLPQDQPLVVVCAKGGGSVYVAELLQGHGYAASSLEGGMIAWGALEQIRPLNSPGGLRVEQFDRLGKGCLSYLIAADGQALVVDPARQIEPYLERARELGVTIRYVVDTHLHADHISGAPALAEAAQATYFLNLADVPAEAAGLASDLADGHEFRLGDARIQVLHTPGHTPGSTSLLVADRYLITGDTLFVRSVGRPDLGGQAEAWSKDLFRSLTEKVATLPRELVVLPGHYGSAEEQGPDQVISARLGDLVAANEGLQIGGERAFTAFIQANMRPSPGHYGEIRKINMRLVSVDEDRAVELELGKNECAASAGKVPAAV